MRGSSGGVSISNHKPAMLGGIWGKVIVILAPLFIVYHLLYVSDALILIANIAISEAQHVGIHLGFALFFAFLYASSASCSAFLRSWEALSMVSAQTLAARSSISL